MAEVYLLHFNPPYKHAKHYIGFAKDSAIERIKMHRRGVGARLTQVAVENGITLEIAKIWKRKGRKFERELKNKKCAGRFCPMCKENGKAK